MFDPANPAHRAVYARFLKTGNFESKFYIEVPQYHTMLEMIRSKLSEYAVRAEMPQDVNSRKADDAALCSMAGIELEVSPLFPKLEQELAAEDATA